MMVMVFVIIGVAVMFALCKAGILLPVHIVLRLICLMFFCGMNDNGQAENMFSEKEKLSPSKMVRGIRTVLIVSFFVLLWPYTFLFPSFQELSAGIIIFVPVSMIANIITSVNCSHESLAKDKVLLTIHLTASDIFTFCLILPMYYLWAFVAAALSA